MDSRPLAQAKLILRQCLHRRYFPIYAFGLLFVLFGINIIHRSGTYNFHPAAFAIANQDHNLVRFFSLPTSHIQLVRETSNIIPLPHTADFATADDLDTWVSTGNYNTTTRFSDIRFDIVYTWVNGSDKQLQRQKAPWEDRSIVFNISAAAREFSVDQEEEDTNFQKWKTLKTDKRYRDFDELRYSVRSIEQYIGDLARQITILSADFPLESPGDEPDSVTFVPDPDAPNIVRTGQVPQWLHPSILRNHSFTSTTSASRLRFVHHSQIFLPPYHHTHLPTFSSNAIESHLADVPHLLPHFVYMNDDVFFGSPIVASDFWTPLHGFVFHTVRGLLVKPERTVVEVDGKDPAGGEWPALEWSNELLCKYLLFYTTAR
ncbi:hypothetical protein BC936DRAFT_138283 [Jimgerdemannia flammicorona]|uniref:Uncharacterized protein n=1 Tax=Jimgerdemannia flammicorona TaxID=994334 RepID=A0A433CTI1_9FUNG|nr:hypothetical protein BC936DRAFT_138283 [Jimgerdemannia flammicorona]